MTVYYANKKIKSLYYENRKIKRAYFGNHLVYDSEEEVLPYLEFRSADPNVEFALIAENRNWDGMIEYSIDKEFWNFWGGEGIYSNQGSLYLRGKDNSYVTSGYEDLAWKIEGDTEVDCYGCFESLLDWEKVINNEEFGELQNGTFDYMFYNCTSIRKAPDIRLEELPSTCFSNTFYGCTSLTQAPSMKNVKRVGNSAFQRTFYNCTSLENPPEMSFEEVGSSGCKEMFAYCSSLRSAPALPATSLESSCYLGMFFSCSSLTEVPSLPCTNNLPLACYSRMFRGCSSLLYAPELPAMEVGNGCYTGMFYDCTSLKEVPELPATELEVSSYNGMFTGCTSIENIPRIYARTIGTNALYNIFKDSNVSEVHLTAELSGNSGATAAKMGKSDMNVVYDL